MTEKKPTEAPTADEVNGVPIPDVPGDKVVDVVAVPSLRADGSPDQTPGFVQLVDDQDDQRAAVQES